MVRGEKKKRKGGGRGIANHLGEVGTWEIGLLGKGRGRGLRVREGRVRKGATSFKLVHPQGQEQGICT
jgi:hypothetical protein